MKKLLIIMLCLIIFVSGCSIYDNSPQLQKEVNNIRNSPELNRELNNLKSKCWDYVKNEIICDIQNDKTNGTQELSHLGWRYETKNQININRRSEAVG